MYVKMNNIDIYNNSAIILKRKQPKSIISWITILIILLVLLIILFYIPFNNYKNYMGYVIIDDDSSYLNIDITLSDFPINMNNKLYIKSDKYDYDIITVNEDNIILKLDLKEELKVNYNIVPVNVLSSRTTVLEILKNKIRKGFSL